MESAIYLESVAGNTGVAPRIEITEFPARVGRQDSCEIQINVSRISRTHAIIDCSGEQIFVSDVGSTNGTFVNHKRINQATPLLDGDVVHFADFEFRFRNHTTQAEGNASDATAVWSDTLPGHFPTQAREFNELLEQGLVEGFAQPVLNNDGTLFGHELLGRGTHPDLGASPYEMFKLAEATGLEIELSELLRQRSFAQADSANIRTALFFNSHPKECLNPDRLIVELQRLRKLHSSLDLIFEIHESAVTDLALMSHIRSALRDMDIRLAYDDFGAGQARLLELIEVPPQILKFDIGLISGIKSPDSPKYKLLSSLNTLVKNMGIQTLAEGIETEEEALACRTIGVDYFQGYYYGRPAPIARSSSK